VLGVAEGFQEPLEGVSMAVDVADEVVHGVQNTCFEADAVLTT
jgi:hypothetical protein